MAYWVSGSVLPFDDQQVRHIPIEMSSSNPAMDTSLIDKMRQGVELRRTSDFYSSTQPKLWGGRITLSGTITHEQSLTVPGQATSFTEFFATHIFTEVPNFNPASYITLGNHYPLPIMMNGGPQQQQEAIIEPLTIPFRLPDTEGRDVARTVRGELLGGNKLDGRLAGTSRVEQFVDHALPLVVRPWLELGETRLGDTVTGSIYVPGFIAKEQRTLAPVVDQSTNNSVLSLVTSHSDTTMSGALQSLRYGLGPDTDLRPLGKRSAAAGTVVYGPGMARVGTDSVAYAGRLRGS